MKSPLRLTALLTLIALAIVPSARPEELKSADAVLQFALAKNDAYQSFSADFTQSMSSFGAEMTFHGSLQFKRPALVRMTAAAPVMGHERRMLMVTGPDKIMWQEVSTGGRTNIMKMDFRTIPTNNPAVAAMRNPLDTIDPKKQLSSAIDRYNFTLLPAIDRQPESLYVLQGVLKPDAKLSSQESATLDGLGPQKLYIGQQTGFLMRLEQLDKSGTNTLKSIEFTNIKFNPPMADDLFIFTPPARTDVADMTQLLLQKMGVQTVTNIAHDTYSVKTIIHPDGTTLATNLPPTVAPGAVIERTEPSTTTVPPPKTK